MSPFYSGRHRAVRPSLPTSRKAGLGVAAAAALTLAAPAMTITGASAAPATVTAPSTNTTFTGIVKQGARGDIVRQIQRKVGASADGVFGPATRAAVQRYQRSKGLVADGVVGPRTAAKMGLSRSSSSTSSSSRSSGSSSSSRSTTRSASTFTGTVRQGARGDIVRQIQREVGASADGVFGPATRAAVQRYQRSKGLVADGVVGPRTGSVMGLNGSSSGGSSGGGGGTTSTPTPSTTTTTSSSSVLETAARYVGAPYRYGGTSPSGWDCSGFTQYVFGQHGKSLPRTASAQKSAATPVSSPRPGDLVFIGSPAWHVGIYAGNGQMYDAGNSRVNTTKRAIWTTTNVTYGRF